MSPRQHDYTPIEEEASLINDNNTSSKKSLEFKSHPSDINDIGDINIALNNGNNRRSTNWLHLTTEKLIIVSLAVLFVILGNHLMQYTLVKTGELVPTGPYRLLQSQEGKKFFDYYDFYDGADSIGSAGYNMYVSKKKAMSLGIANVITGESVSTSNDTSDDTSDQSTEDEFVFMSSAPTEEGPRSSIRLEGKTRFERGLFLLDVRHMPNGCGVWPAFWLTDEASWPRNGEIDILEDLLDCLIFLACVLHNKGVNGQTVAKTALHTSDKCDMYAHVSPYDKTGEWEWITGIPNQYTGEPDLKTSKEADNCWVMAQHQWANEGCTAIHDRNDTIGGPVNDVGGGVYALEWDPENRHIKSWVFSPRDDMPQNLIEAIETASSEDASKRIMPDPHSWGL
eukprot:scaffold15487_cov200-Alexandrium_tamarense.AAC.1